LFRDVAHIVREQGNVLDTIDVNVENTLTDTRGAEQHDWRFGYREGSGGFRKES
jgi:hypothetical protein